MSTPTNHNNVTQDLKDLFNNRSEEKETEHDSYMLMAAFLSEIEAIQEKEDISRKELAEKIKISPSYLTQVFRSKKPLNFLTLAKIKRALNIRFEVKANRISQINNNVLIGSQIAKVIPIKKFEYNKLEPDSLSAGHAQNDTFVQVQDLVQDIKKII